MSGEMVAIFGGGRCARGSDPQRHSWAAADPVEGLREAITGREAAR